MSGTKAGCPGLSRALNMLREGDTVVVWKLIASAAACRTSWNSPANARGIGFVSIADSIDTTTVSGRFFFNVMATLTQMESELMVERTQAWLGI